MKYFTIFGNPVEHSISPIMHTYAIRGLGLDAIYTKTLLEDPAELKPLFLEKFDGANVTVPHKEAAFAQCDSVMGIAERIGAVNTLVKKEGKMVGYNTDAEGFYRSIAPFGKISRVMILGAGGSAKAIAYILGQKGMEVTILNRTADRLKAFGEFETMTWESYKSATYDLLVNTTSAGLDEEILPAPEAIMKDLFSHTAYAVDIIYNKKTPFLRMAERYRVPAKDGADMLLYQGVLAFNLFYDNRFAFEEIEKYMKKAFV